MEAVDEPFKNVLIAGAGEKVLSKPFTVGDDAGMPCARLILLMSAIVPRVRAIVPPLLTAILLLVALRNLPVVELNRLVVCQFSICG